MGGSRAGSPRCRPPYPRGTITAIAVLLAGCGGGAPLLHPAHVLAPGQVMAGAGLSGQLALVPSSTAATSPNQGSLQDLAVAPGVAPWVSGRAGIPGSNEGGLTYSGHALRVDARHAFELNRAVAISLGVGATAVLARRPGDSDASGVYGGGADVPLLIGVRSSSDIYAFWFGPRGGFDILSGGLQLGQSSPVLDVSARHFYGGLVAGLRVGFRHVHVAIELDAAYHRVDGSFRPSAASTTPTMSTSASLQQISLTPAGALEVTF
jgi:hypothetical protein